MLALFIGDGSLLLGFAVLLLPLLVTELSRPRDALWGAVILLLGLLLITNHDRLSAPLVVGVVLNAVLIIRLGKEVALSRWQQLSSEEKHRLASIERWTTGTKQFFAAICQLGGFFGGIFKSSASKTTQKKWIRPENSKGKDVEDEVTIHAKDEFLTSIESEQQPRKTLEGHNPPKDS